MKRVTLVGIYDNHRAILMGILRSLVYLGCETTFVGDKSVVATVKENLGDDAKSVQFHVIADPGREALEQVRKLAQENTDLLIFDEYYLDIHVPCRMKWPCPAIYMTHNLRMWFTNRRVRGVEELKRNFSLRVFRKNYEAFAVPTLLQKQWIENNSTIKTPVHVCLGCLFDEDTWSQRRNHRGPIFEVTVSGSVFHFRRDYSAVLDAWEKAFKNDWGIARLTLLGRMPQVPSAKIRAHIERLKSEGAQIDYFDDNVPQDKFVTHLSKTDLSISPLLIEKQYSIYPYTPFEIPGHTKISGSILEQITFALPTLYPTGYPIDPTMKKSVTTYDNVDHLAQLLREFADDRSKLDPLDDAALEFSRTNTLEQVAEREVEPLLEHAR